MRTHILFEIFRRFCYVAIINPVFMTLVVVHVHLKYRELPESN